MNFSITNRGPVITIEPGTRFQAILQPSNKPLAGLYTIMSLIGYDRCATCMGRIHITNDANTEGWRLMGYECQACHNGLARLTSPDGAESNWDSFALRGTILPYVCSRRPHTLIERPYFPHYGNEGNIVGVRWSGDLFSALCPLGLYVLKYAFTDLTVHNRIGAHLTQVRAFGANIPGCFTQSNWLIIDTQQIGISHRTSLDDWSGIRRRLTQTEYLTFEPSLLLGIDVANEICNVRRAATTPANVRNEFRAVLRAIGLNVKTYKPDPEWQAKVEKTLAGFGDVKKLLK